jgi:hypothetical protein
MTGGTNEGAEKNDDGGVNEVHGEDDWTEGENCLFFNVRGAETLIPGSRPLKSVRFLPIVFSIRGAGTLIPGSHLLSLVFTSSWMRKAFHPCSVSQGRTAPASYIQLKAVGTTLRNQPEEGHCFWSKRCHSHRCDLRGTRTSYRSGHSKSAHSPDRQ